MLRLHEIVSESLSPDQLKRMFHPKSLDVVEYDKLISHPNLNYWFGKDNAFVLYYPNTINPDGSLYGHYVSLVRNPKTHTIYFYDSYGFQPDTSQKESNQRRQLYKEDQNSLIDAFLRSGLNIDYSPYKHQSKRDSVATCGRHSLMRILCKDLDCDQYDRFIKSICKEYGLNPDELVSIIWNGT